MLGAYTITFSTGQELNVELRPDLEPIIVALKNQDQQQVKNALCDLATMSDKLEFLFQAEFFKKNDFPLMKCRQRGDIYVTNIEITQGLSYIDNKRLSMTNHIFYLEPIHMKLTIPDWIEHGPFDFQE